ncbi:MAG: EAL domain-containing protein [Gammaproteobacteria bacterium]|nr:MAG: EAL domain-containing protein [Gammaproteobacteria bacterium]
MRETQHLKLPGGDSAYPGGDLLLIFTVAPDGRPERCIQANNEACQVLGFSRTILFGLDPNGLFAEPLPQRHGDVDAWFPIKLRNAAGSRIELSAQVFQLRTGSERLMVLSCRDLASGQHTAQRQRTQLAAMEASQDGIAILNDRFECVYSNEALVKLYGYPARHALLNKPWQDFCPENDWQHLRRTVYPAVRKSGHWHGEINGRRNDGTVFPQEISLTALDDDSVVCIVRDITERREAEMALKRAEAEYHSIFENALEGIFRVTPEGQIISANRAMAQILGYSSPKELKDKVQDVGTDIYLDRNERLRQIKELEKRGSHQEIEFWLRRRDDTPIWVTVNERVVRDDDGNILYFEGSLQDITARREADDALHASEEKFRTLVEHSQDGVFIQQDGRYVYVNRALASMLGYQEEDLIGVPFLDTVCPEDRRLEEGRMQRKTDGNPLSNQHEVRMLHKDGQTVLCSVNAGLMDYEGGMAITGTVRDITEQKRAEEQLLYDAYHDNLTALPNRAVFVDRLQQAMRRSSRRPDPSFAVLFVDLDSFKLVNDSFGHELGDRLLVEIARRFSDSLRGGDTVARHGGDEFTILLEDISGIEDAINAAKRIRADLHTPFRVGEHTIFASASTGIVIGNNQYKKPEELLRDADTAMYRAKSQGKGGYVVFDKHMHAHAKARLALETDLRLAVERKEFRLYYQPVVKLSDRQVVGFEALLRWQHPARGILSPSQFLKVAEEIGLAMPIGWWVLESASRQMQTWHDTIPQTRHITLSVNIANRQFAQPDLATRIKNILDVTGFPTQLLHLEITENVFVENPEVARETFKQLKALGVDLQVDDFGTGYSSLSTLRNFPIDTLKIDKSFVRDIQDDASNLAIIRTITDLAAVMNMKVIAEGVESVSQATILKNLGCAYAQGFYFARPLEPRAVTLLLQRKFGERAVSAG